MNNLRSAILLASLWTLTSFWSLVQPANAWQSGNQQQWCTYEPVAGGIGEGKHIVLISGDEEYRSEEALPMLGKILTRHHGFKCTVLFAIDPESGKIDPNNQSHIPGMEHLEDADLVIMALRFRALPDEQMKYFDEYLKAGKPVIALRTSTHAFRYGNDVETSYGEYGFNAAEPWQGGFGKEVLGETWVSHHGHHGKESTRGILNEEFSDDTILRGVTDIWGPTDVYGVRQLPDDCRVLVYGQVLAGMHPESTPVEGEKNAPMMPLAWTRNWDAGNGNHCPIFCTTMGAANDFESEGLRRLILNVALQFTGLEMAIDESLNVDFVDKFQPTNFGFNAFRKGRKPADYDLK